jgi:photosystem II stability/assembly factor-like uncharacterized protein
VWYQVLKNDNPMQVFFRACRRLLPVLAAVLLCTSCNGFAAALGSTPWELVELPTDSTLLDIAFSSKDPNHGWLVGGKSTILETRDGGQTWEPRVLETDEQAYRLTSVSFAGDDGWIVGQPSILLHTTDGGKAWTRVSLSAQLPGDPNTIAALGPQSAEMTTDVGAIYRTQDGGQTWQAMVQEAVGVVRNIARSPEGQYVAVSSRGNFYSTWEPGQAAWEQHNRNTSRRLQNMGFDPQGHLWLLARSGQLQFSDSTQDSGWSEPQNPQFSVSMGLLDLAYRTPEEIWVAGGSGNLLCSVDGGQTWQKDRAVEQIPSNFYKIVFVTPEQGFILGQKGILLRYKGSTETA